MLANSKTYERSDQVTLRGKLQSGFGNYDGYLLHPTVVSVEKPNPPDFSEQIRSAFVGRIRELFSAEESALALGYLVGDKTGMSEALATAIRAVGLSHMVVVSGYHLGLVVDLSKRVLGKVSRAAVIVGSFAVILFFISIAGFGASMMRAGLTTMITLIAWYCGRKFHPVRILLYVASITLLISPSLIMSLAWQLSFASYVGIIIITPVLTTFLYGEQRKPGFIASNIIASVSAQIVCLPISIYNFGAISVVSILAILLISPTVPFVMLLSFLSVIVPPISFVAKPLIDFNLFVITRLSEIPWAVFEVPASDARIFLVYIPIVLVFTWLKRRAKYDFRPRYTLDKI